MEVAEIGPFSTVLVSNNVPHKRGKNRVSYYYGTSDLNVKFPNISERLMMNR